MMQEDIKRFREYMWLIELLTTDALRNIKKSQNHWTEIFNSVFHLADDDHPNGLTPAE